MIRHRQRLLPGPLSTWLAHYDGARLEPMPSRASIQLDSLARKSTDERRSLTCCVQPMCPKMRPRSGALVAQPRYPLLVLNKYSADSNKLTGHRKHA